MTDDKTTLVRSVWALTASDVGNGIERITNVEFQPDTLRKIHESLDSLSESHSKAHLSDNGLQSEILRTRYV